MKASARVLLSVSGVLIVIVAGGAIAGTAVETSGAGEPTWSARPSSAGSEREMTDIPSAGGAASGSAQLDPSPGLTATPTPTAPPSPAALPSPASSPMSTPTPAASSAAAGDQPDAGQPPTSAAPSPTTSPSFVENFAGARGSAPNPSNWSAEVGAGGWGNGELQTYTAQSAYLDGSGHLIIEARRRVDAEGRVTWTSGRLSSYGKQSFGFGTLTARIRLPDGQGLLPAFWTMGDGLYRVGWPAAGEIDVVEAPNSTARSSHNSHGPATSSSFQKTSVEASRAWSTPLSGAFHDFSVERTPGHVVIRVDGTIVSDFTRASIRPDLVWVFDEPQHALFSLAVGGNWPGNPTDATSDTSIMVVDWVRFVPAG